MCVCVCELLDIGHRDQSICPNYEQNITAGSSERPPGTASPDKLLFLKTMLSIARTPPYLWVFSPPYQKQYQNCSTTQNSSVFKPSPISVVTGSTFSAYQSCSGLKAFCVLTETIDHETKDTRSQIQYFCELGNLKIAVELMLKSQKSDLDLRSYSSVLQLCADRKSVEGGRKVHAVIDKHGFKIDSLLGTKLVFMYVKCGDLKEGRRIFDKIANEKVFLWNLLINEYAKIRRFQESISLFQRMQVSGIEMNAYTFSCVLKSFAAIGSASEGEAVHCYVLKVGFDSNSVVLNSLIAFYFKCGRTAVARKLFDKMTDRDVISWNSMISGYASNGLFGEGLDMFIQMLYSGIGTDMATMVSAIAACAKISSIFLGKELHAYSIKRSFDVEVTVSNTLLDMYSKCGDLDSSVRLFDRMDERSVVSWTSMIAAYAREGLPDNAIKLFHKMDREGLKPDVFTVTSVLHACACNGSLENGRNVHDFIRENDMQSIVSVSNSLMDMYAKCGSIEDAYTIFSQMHVRDAVSWNTMIGGYSKSGLPNEALELFVEMQEESKPDSRTIASTLPACASLAALERGREIHGYILRKGFDSDGHVANALIDMYVKCGVLVLARLLFDMIPVKDLVSWTVMIAGYGMHGFGSEAIATFNDMRIAGIEPNEVSFASILYACSHTGLVREGWKFFNIMKNECNINPRMEHYVCMVDLLSRAGDLMEAYRFIQTMPLKPDAATWGSLLYGCRYHHNVKLAEEVAEHVFKLDPENTGYYLLLANTYTEAEKWGEVKKLRKKIGRYGLKKNPSYSWIEIRGKVHIFAAGDGSYPQAKRVQSLLLRLGAKMMEEGFVLKTKFGLMNADTRQKESAVCGHSERLAMAFGLLNLSAGKTIRVAKNLRVCGDCHEMAKFMSRTAGREIVLRDSNRFHHFKDGQCSCRGYW